LSSCREEILDVGGVAISLGGGPSIAYCPLHLMDGLNEEILTGGTYEV